MPIVTHENSYEVNYHVVAFSFLFPIEENQQHMVLLGQLPTWSLEQGKGDTNVTESKPGLLAK